MVEPGENWKNPYNSKKIIPSIELIHSVKFVIVLNLTSEMTEAGD